MSWHWVQAGVSRTPATRRPQGASPSCPWRAQGGHVGKGLYAAGPVDERERVAAVLRKFGEPRWLPARTTALGALGIPVAVPDPAAVTTSLQCFHGLAAVEA